MRDENVVESIIPKGHQRFQGTCVRRGLTPKNQDEKLKTQNSKLRTLSHTPFVVSEPLPAHLTPSGTGAE